MGGKMMKKSRICILIIVCFLLLLTALNCLRNIDVDHSVRENWKVSVFPVFDSVIVSKISDRGPRGGGIEFYTVKSLLPAKRNLGQIELLSSDDRFGDRFIKTTHSSISQLDSCQLDRLRKSVGEKNYNLICHCHDILKIERIKDHEEDVSDLLEGDGLSEEQIQSIKDFEETQNRMEFMLVFQLNDRERVVFESLD